MLSIDSTPLNYAAPSAQPTPGTASEGQTQAAQQAAPSASEGVRVNLSTAGLQASKSSSRDKDIDESGLPQTIQQAMKMVRKLQQQLAEKMQQLQAVMRDDSLSPDEMRQKVSSLQGEISTLTGALTTANATLAKAIKQQNLSLEQVAKVYELLG